MHPLSHLQPPDKSTGLTSNVILRGGDTAQTCVCMERPEDNLIFRSHHLVFFEAGPLTDGAGQLSQAGHQPLGLRLSPAPGF